MKINNREQQIVANILTRFMFTKNMDEVIEVWNHIYEEYNLCEDPFTGIPCTEEEYFKRRLEYDKQVMIERYGHCDGLD